MTLVTDPSPYARWLEYFEARRGEGPVAALGEPLERVPGREVLARSIARFELGESGHGERIRRLALATGDDAYARSIELFVREEQQHARWLKKPCASASVAAGCSRTGRTRPSSCCATAAVCAARSACCWPPSSSR